MTTQFEIENEEYYSFLIVPPSGQHVKKWRIHKKKVALGCWVGGITAVLLLVAFGITTYTAQKIQRYQALQNQTQQHAHNIKQYDSSIKQMKKKIQQLIEQEELMKTILGKQPPRRWRKRAHRRIKELNKNYAAIDKSPADFHLKIRLALALMTDSLATVEHNMQDLSQKIQQYRARFSLTPSISPVYGGILSGYGWRTHPKTGRLQFHKGVDIPSWLGAPIKATADGVVEFSGWAGGYGWLIIIEHGYGYRTLYAHLSEINVDNGQQIVKGQIIGKIGETGITTGPHIHYEIRRWRQSISPKPYLKLDLFTAITYLW